MIHPSLDYLTYFSNVFGIEMTVRKWVGCLKWRSLRSLPHSMYHCHALVTAGWCWPEKVGFANFWMLSGPEGAGCSRALALVMPRNLWLSVPSPLRDETPENLRLFVCYLPVK